VKVLSQARLQTYTGGVCPRLCLSLPCRVAAAFGVVAPELREGRAGYNRLWGREFVFLGFKTPDDHARFEALAPRMHVDEFADVATVVVPGKRALAFRAFWIRP